MPYTIEQNILNQGSLAGRYALKDLSNTGKYSGYINKLPIRRDVEYSYDSASSTFRITVGEGSVFTVPNKVTVTDSGERDCLYVRAAKEYALPITFNKGAKGDALDASRFVYIVYDCDADMLVACLGKEDYPAEKPFVHHALTELQHINVSFAYYTTTLGEHKCSLPIGYFDGALNWHTFDAFGFVDSIFWVEEDVQGLFPVGRDTASNYKNRVVDNTWLTFTKFTTSDAKVIPTGAKCMMLKKSGKVEAALNYDVRDTFTDITEEDLSGYYLALDTNLMYRKINVPDATVELVDGYVYLCDFTFDGNNRITSLSHINTYKTQDIVGFHRKIDEIKALVESLNVGDTLEKVQEDIATLTELVDSIQGDDFISKIQGVLSLESTVNELSDEVEALKGDLQAKVEEVNTVLQTLQGDALVGDVTALKRNVSELSGKISTLQTAGVNTTRDIKDLQTSVDSLTNRVNDLEVDSGSGAEVSLQISALQEVTARHSQEISDVQGSVASVVNDCENLSTSVANMQVDNEQEFIRLDGEITAVSDDMDECSEFVEALQEQVDTLEAKVATLETTIADLTARLEALE